MHKAAATDRPDNLAARTDGLEYYPGQREDDKKVLEAANAFCIPIFIDKVEWTG